ncbi:MAG: Re/Si-specific NAD(P)(+) transhydrogenase subunit alpha [Proteobacteria bacterium]|nr:Re/Si-specific NAD(P)(+) transhydrogenase subunit alpha [Pseudomonadota bacterium]
MIIGVPKESAPGETRVALVPETVGKWVKGGAEVVIESGAGVAAGCPDDTYTAVGAKLAGSAKELFAQADTIVKVQAPTVEEVQMMKDGAFLLSFVYPVQNLELVKALNAKKITCYAMDAVPRISRAQVMDALSSMATVGGYKAVLYAAVKQVRFFPMLTTAAGTIAPARVVILGVGVAGLQAIATARRLGAVVEAYDVRPAVKEQVESLGAKFIDSGIKAEGAGGYAREQTDEEKKQAQDVLAKHIAAADVVITTALVPGKKAPILVNADHVKSMKPGSVIVDMAAEQGGNCELTEPGQDVTKHGVLICGVINLPASMPFHASQMYSRNIHALLSHLYKSNALALDFNEEVCRDAAITHEGEVRHAATKAAMGA